ncbi:MAG: PCMD domain-containing protein, partial [Prevotellaceae bacterium]|nr:PCMD domain-containing protein [Prevotellaceae bacterium]
MNIIKKHLIYLAALAALLASCAKIDELSDHNQLKGFNIISHTPTAMELGAAQIESDIIYINIDFGEYLFPLRFFAEPIFDNSIDRVTGIDFSKELTLETANSELFFFVMAPSGLTRRYTIKTRITPLENNVAISRFFTIKEQDPFDMLISEEGVTISLWEQGERRDTLKIFTIDGRYPVMIMPEFNIAASSRFGTFTTSLFDNGNTPLLFESVDDTYKIKVIAESGLENTWNIALRHAPLVSGSDNTSYPEQCEGSNINPRTFTAMPQGNMVFAIDEVFINNNTENILLVLKKSSAEITFPVEIQVQFPTLNGVQVIGLDRFATIVFEDWNDEKIFYLLDTESCVSRLWKIGLKEWKPSDKEVLSFSCSYTFYQTLSGPSITLDLARTAINSYTGDIYLCMTAVNNALLSSSWRLTLTNVQITVSEGATIELLSPTFVWTGNESWRDPKPFKVIAQDSTEKTWRVNVRDMRNHTPSANCNLAGLTIVRHTPNYAIFDNDDPVIINAGERIVTLKLSDDDEIYPLSVWAQCAVSSFAQVTSQNGGADPLVFADENSGQTITVLAEDGTTSADWTVRLQPPPREAQANVETFRITSTSIGVELDQVTINDEKGSVRLIVYNAISFPIEVSYVMTVSNKATASIPLRGTFILNTYHTPKSFTVTAQDGSIRNWNIRLVYEPQLTNRGLDVWGTLPQYPSIREPVGWSTANNSFVTGTTEVAGNPASGSAAQMRTNRPPIINTIASGTLFLGTFDRTDVLAGMSDPVKLTFFGIPFETSGKVLGIEFDAIYSSGSEFINGTERELGSSTIELVKPKQGQENTPFRYHGLRHDGTPHPLNTAEDVAHTKVVIGNSPGVAWNGSNITVVSNTNWTKVRVLFNFPSGQMPAFTHIHVVFSSSAQGD